MAKFSIAILELLDHNEFTVKDPFNFDNFAKEISTYTSLDAESLLTKFYYVKQSLIVLVIYIIKIFEIENFSN